MYDLNKMHDKTLNYNGIKPYRHPNFNSIYEGVTVEIHVVDHCNLNCANCNHFSPLAKPWFISIEDFTTQIMLLKNNISSIKELLILGGEPTLHPQLGELCQIARQLLPEPIIIRVLSNGVKIKNIKNNIELYNKNNIILDFCYYPNFTDINTIKEIKGQYFATRNVTHQVLVDISGTQNKEINFFNCNKFRLPCLTLKDSKIFICPFIAHLNHFMDKISTSYDLIPGIDYLNITDINNNLDILQDFCFTPKNACKYCNQKNYSQIWHLSSKNINEYIIPFNDLYFINYNEYYNIVNNNLYYFLQCYNKENPKEVDPIYEIDFTSKLIKRLGHGKIDIIIPHYNIDLHLANQLINTLSSQTIINDCIIYFISDDSPNEEILVKLIQNSNLNYVLLKQQSRQGPGSARNLGLEHSFNKYKFFLDADDYFLDEYSLENLYNKAIEKNYDLVMFMMYSNTNQGNKINYLFKNSNIKFTNLYFGEDIVFTSELLSNSNNRYNYNNKTNLFAIYNQQNNNSLSNTIIIHDTQHFNFLVSRFLAGMIDNVNEDFFYQYILFSLDNFYKYNLTTLDDFSKVLLHWIKYTLFQKHKALNLQEQQDFNIILSNNEIIQSNNEAKKYLLNFINKYYLDNIYTSTAANLLLSYLTL